MSKARNTLFFITAACLILSCRTAHKNITTGDEGQKFIVSTKYGRLRGTGEEGVLVWRGIRYAKAPAGALRFKAPVPVDKWDGVKDALEFGPICPQELDMLGSSPESGKQSEDCLFLNIWAPGNAKDAPVMVWFHGGAYVFGAGSLDFYNGTDIARRGVVVVTLNYRLGAFGCMHFSDLAARAGLAAEFDDNPGLRDQVAALKWVRDNISAFGGNPDNITIFGESAGASSVVALLCTPSAKGLFHKAIAQSPSPVSIYSRDTGDAYANKILAAVGLNPDEIGRLKDIPVEVLTKATRDLLYKNAMDRPGLLPFGPTAGTKFFPHDPFTAAGKGATAGVPLIIGTNRDEATLFDHGKSPLLPLKRVQIENMLEYIDPGAKKSVLSAYPEYPDRESRIKFATDAIFRQPTILFADLYSEHAATWAYRFDYASLSLRIAGYGATHGSEIVYVFHNYGTRDGRLITLLTPSPRVRAIGDLMQKTWIAFASAGVPGEEGGVKSWERYTTKDRRTCIINIEPRMVADPDRDRREAWRGVGRYK